MIIWAGQTIGARVQSKPKELRTAPDALGREEKRKNLEKLYYRVGGGGEDIYILYVSISDFLFSLSFAVVFVCFF